MSRHQVITYRDDDLTTHGEWGERELKSGGKENPTASPGDGSQSGKMVRWGVIEPSRAIAPGWESIYPAMNPSSQKNMGIVNRTPTPMTKTRSSR
jgi:hypothetical protein